MKAHERPFGNGRVPAALRAGWGRRMGCALFAQENHTPFACKPCRMIPSILGARASRLLLTSSAAT